MKINEDEKLHITLVNLSAEKDYDIEAVIAETEIKSVSAEIVGGEMHDHNTFDDPEKVTKKAFDAVKANDGKISFSIPKNSVMHIIAEI